MGTATPIASSRSLMCGTAAAASSRSTVTRTISEPARASAATCRAVPSTSAVSVLVMDCTTTGAPPPTVTPPTSTDTDRRRSSGPASVMFRLLLRLCACPYRKIGLRFSGTCDGRARPRPCRQRRWFRAGRPLAPLRRAAVRADAADLDDRRFRREAGGARGRGERAGHFGRRCFTDRAAALADQERDQLAGGVIVHAGDERVAAFDAMHEAVLAQEFERAIGGDRRRARPFECQPVNDLVGAERLVAREQRRQHVAPNGGQPLPALVT